jgi:hypothetical protein
VYTVVADALAPIRDTANTDATAEARPLLLLFIVHLLSCPLWALTG